MAKRWRAGVPRTRGRPDQAARLSDRAGRDRVGARTASASRARRGCSRPRDQGAGSQPAERARARRSSCSHAARGARDAARGDRSACRPTEVRRALDEASPRAAARAELSVTRDSFRLELHTTASGFVAPPREAQRHWLLGRRWRSSPTISSIWTGRRARSFAGSTTCSTGTSATSRQAALTDQEIMEDWQTPLMRRWRVT